MMLLWKSKQLPLARAYTNPGPLMMVKHDVIVMCVFLQAILLCSLHLSSLNQPAAKVL